LRRPREGIADDENTAFFTRLMDEGGGDAVGARYLRDDGSYWPAVARGDEEPAGDARVAVKLEAKRSTWSTSTRTDFSWTNSHHVSGDLRARACRRSRT
jgi:hypothetical protein